MILRIENAEINGIKIDASKGIVGLKFQVSTHMRSAQMAKELAAIVGHGELVLEVSQMQYPLPPDDSGDGPADDSLSLLEGLVPAGVDSVTIERTGETVSTETGEVKAPAKKKPRARKKQPGDDFKTDLKTDDGKAVS